MNRLFAVLERLRDDLDSLRAAWAVVGGLAVAARSEPRVTRDVDVAVDVAGDEGGGQVVHALLRAGYRLVAVQENTVTGRMATVRLTPPDGAAAGTLVDLLFASSGIEARASPVRRRSSCAPD